ncbi:SUMF1/EgtB/PvdO family nonheme iron enzyme, partial [Candidatus Latescibacterota bacterium]
MINRYAVYPTLFAAIVFCTTVSASITGTVTDTIGNPVSDAFVTFTGETDPGIEYSDYTDDKGKYELATSPLHVNEEVPSGFQLYQNYPNPFNPSTTITFSLVKAGFVNLSVYNITGQKVSRLIDNYLSSGSHTITWGGIGDDGKRIAAGMYLYQLKSSDHIESRKMLLIDGGNVNIIPTSDHYYSSSKKSILAKPIIEAEDTLYRVRVTGKDIAVYEESGVNAPEGEPQDFVVKRLPGGLTFVAIPGGTFQMGDVENAGWTNEYPVHTVTLSGFEMSSTEITNSQYSAYLNEMLASDGIFINIHNIVYRKTDDWTGEEYIGLRTKYTPEIFSKIEFSDSTSTFFVPPGKENFPVICVTWYGAKAFALHYGLDLPTEEEWEYAARGGKQYKYATDDGTLNKSKANFQGSLGNLAYPVEVGSYPPNPFELYDMSGNVMEWCNDKYNEDYITENIIYLHRVYRGGSWGDDIWKCRTAYRWNWY